MIDKLKDCFGEMVIYKNLKKSNFFNSLSLPSFMRDFVLQKYQDEEGNFDVDKVKSFLDDYYPKKEDLNKIKDRLLNYETVKILGKISVNIDISSGEYSFSLPELGIKNAETIIERYDWERFKEHLLGQAETWGLMEMQYKPPMSKKGKGGQIKLVSFKPFCPYEIDIEDFKDAREEFSFDEWLNVLIGAIDYNPTGYVGSEPEEQKKTLLTRLLPFIEKRLNLIELAPKGTGKSYLFGRLSRYGWQASGGKITRAKMFYDMTKRAYGFIQNRDFITFDEIQTISFPEEDEMRSILKEYLESGRFIVGNHNGESNAGLILCGNIEKSIMDSDGTENMFNELPSCFHESALIDRFHGFIKGWKIPRMNDDLKMQGWALNSEYFTSILHALRDDGSYRLVVDEMIEVPPHADTRDTEAIKRITTAYLKLFFPNVRTPEDISFFDFDVYCLKRARKMRSIILDQLGLLDSEYRGRSIPDLHVVDKFRRFTNGVDLIK